MEIDNEAIEFVVYQTIRKSPHIATEEEKRRLEQ
jgi:hypothetical protein